MRTRRDEPGPAAPASPAVTVSQRRRRPREETRQVLLDAATRLVVSRLAEDGEFGNPLSAVRIADVLEFLNTQGEAEHRPPMTTGAVYQIWSSQAEFQSDLLDHVMDVVATFGGEDFQATVRSLMADGVPYDRLLAAMTALEPDETHAAHGEITLSVGLAALVSPERIRLAEASANEVYAARMGALLAETLEYGGREMRPGLTIDDLVWVVEAFAAGMEVRARTHPEVVARRDAAGRHAFSRAYAGLFDALTVPRSRDGDGLASEP